MSDMATTDLGPFFERYDRRNRLVLGPAVCASQALMASMVFGYQLRGDLIPRAAMVAMGAASIWLGNLWPRMPTPRLPGPKAARRMRANRFSGWLMVISGLMAALLGLLLPLIYPWLQHRA